MNSKDSIFTFTAYINIESMKETFRVLQCLFLLLQISNGKIFTT